MIKAGIEYRDFGDLTHWQLVATGHFPNRLRARRVVDAESSTLVGTDVRMHPCHRLDVVGADDFANRTGTPFVRRQGETGGETAFDHILGHEILLNVAQPDIELRLQTARQRGVDANLTAGASG